MTGRTNFAHQGSGIGGRFRGWLHRWSSITVAATLTATVGVVAMTPSVAYAANIVVRSAADGAPANDGACTLREAILNANSDSQAGSSDCGAGDGDDVIVFEISGGGVHTIAPTSDLPTITDSLTIDGYSQPGASVNTAPAGGTNAVLMIELFGGGTIPNGLSFAPPVASNASLIVRGLAIDGFIYGIALSGGLDSEIVGNFIGTPASGVGGLGNQRGIVSFDSVETRVGSSDAAERNLIANNDEGVSIWQGTTGMQVQGNLIGTTPTGLSAQGNNGCGDVCNLYGAIVIRNFASGNTIGGINPGEGNVIMYNSFALVAFSGTQNAVLGNSMRFNGGGISVFTNQTGGVSFYAPNGANQIQVPPILDEVRISDGNLVGKVTTVDQPFARQYPLRVEFYRGDEYLNRQGADYLGFVDIAAAGTSTFNLLAPLMATVASGDPVIAVATDANGNSSESSGSAIVGGLTVNDFGDQPDYAANDGVCEASPGGGDCTLRAAIEEANSSADRSYITFDLPGSGVRTLQPLSQLPAINAPVTIDGYTQPGATPNSLAVGNNANILVELIAPIGGADHALSFAGDVAGTTVRGLAVRGDFLEALSLVNVKGVTIEGNFIGITAAGTANPLQSIFGVSILDTTSTGQPHLIGGSLPAQRNVISGNQYGIGVQDLGGSMPHRFINNYIGTNPAGTAAIGNTIAGVISSGGQPRIGGSAPGEGNLISGNNVGVSLSDSSAELRGNFIGTRANGLSALGNINGIDLVGTGLPGIAFIGDSSRGGRNVISGNTTGVTTSNHLIQLRGNYIGVGVDGVTPVGNTAQAVVLNGDFNVVGGGSPRDANIIVNNLTGVTVGNNTGNFIVGNAIFNSGGTPILHSSGSPNDPGDADGGANNGQNAPVLSAASVNADTLTFDVSIDSLTTNSAYPISIDVYEAASGPGVGTKTYLGRVDVAAPGTSAGRIIRKVYSRGLVGGDLIVATATDQNGNTSQASAIVVTSGSDTADSTPPITEDRAAVNLVEVGAAGQSRILPSGSVVYWFGGELRRQDLDGTITEITVGAGGPFPTDVAPSGDVYFLNGNSVFRADGGAPTFVVDVTNNAGTPVDIAINPVSGRLYFTTSVQPTVQSVALSGAPNAALELADIAASCHEIDFGNLPTVGLCGTTSIDIDSSGNVFFLDEVPCLSGAPNCARVVKLTSADVTTVGGLVGPLTPTTYRDGVDARTVSLPDISDLAAGPDGSVYLAESDRNRIRRIAPNGTIATVVGTGSAAVTSLPAPALSSVPAPSSVDVAADGAIVYTSAVTREVNAIVDLELDITLTSAVTTFTPGVSIVPTRFIPSRAIDSPSTDNLAGSLASTSIGSIGDTDLPSTLAPSPLRSVPLRSVPLRSVLLSSTPLRSVTLSSIPIDVPGGWETLLAGTPLAGKPLQSVSLDDALNPALNTNLGTGGPADLNEVPFGALDLSATPLRSVALAAIALGATPLRSVPLPSDVAVNGTGDPGRSAEQWRQRHAHQPHARWYPVAVGPVAFSATAQRRPLRLAVAFSATAQRRTRRFAVAFGAAAQRRARVRPVAFGAAAFGSVAKRGSGRLAPAFGAVAFGGERRIIDRLQSRRLHDRGTDDSWRCRRRWRHSRIRRRRQPGHGGDARRQRQRGRPRAVRARRSQGVRQHDRR
jgi:CSLREA domain-containing protein